MKLARPGLCLQLPPALCSLSSLGFRLSARAGGWKHREGALYDDGVPMGHG